MAEFESCPVCRIRIKKWDMYRHLRFVHKRYDEFSCTLNQLRELICKAYFDGVTHANKLDPDGYADSVVNQITKDLESY